MSGPLTRPRANRMIGGVSAGIAQATGLDLGLVRVLTVLAILFTSGIGLVAYIVCCFVLPES
ncbi:MAG: PspC domain-containing protein [Propionibacteriaceae bacterium]|nr:PspC domain-containing protein [Propionibacteriaceae bacterium]